MGNESERRSGCSEEPVRAGYQFSGIWGPIAPCVSGKSQPKAVANFLLQVYIFILKILNKISFPLTLCWVPAWAFAWGYSWSLQSAAEALILCCTGGLETVCLNMPEFNCFLLRILGSSLTKCKMQNVSGVFNALHSVCALPIDY